MDADDEFSVKISTDCGVTWTTIKTYNSTTPISNTGQSETVDLSTYSGQTCRVGFYASEGTISGTNTDLFIDDLKFDVFQDPDFGVTAVTAPVPGSTFCGTASQPVSVTIKNYGCAPITTIPVTVTVTGAVSQTVSGTYTGVAIAHNQTATFTVGNLNMTTGGTYNFSAATTYSGDLVAGNNTTTATFSTVNPGPLTMGVSQTPVCNPTAVDLTVTPTLISGPPTILTENFESGEFDGNCQLHFRTALRTQGLPEPPKTEWRWNR